MAKKLVRRRASISGEDALTGKMGAKEFVDDRMRSPITLVGDYDEAAGYIRDKSTDNRNYNAFVRDLKERTLLGPGHKDYISPAYAKNRLPIS